ncbi:MAG TPA: hypothetical protein VGF55_06585 [Gemmataceae bacterium]|jgi:hypothetical protein
MDRRTRPAGDGRPGRLYYLVPAACCLLLAGCAPGKADVTGRVTHKGKAVVVGTVIARGPDGIEMTGGIRPDGTYAVQGVTAGAVKLAVVSRDPAVVGARARAGKGRADGKEDADKGGGPVAPPPPTDAQWFPLPDKYESTDTSGVETTLKAGPNQFDVELP